VRLEQGPQVGVAGHAAVEALGGRPSTVVVDSSISKDVVLACSAKVIDCRLCLGAAMLKQESWHQLCAQNSIDFLALDERMPQPMSSKQRAE
jgi:hypothetical protein